VIAQQWSHEDERPFAWLSLDESDNDPVALLTYLMLAMQRLEPVDPGILALLAEDGRAIHEVALPRFGRMLRNRQHPFVLLLDDAGTLTSSDALAVLDVIAHHLPDGCQLAMVGRQAPALDWGALRVQRKLIDLDASTLRLTHAEARALVEAADFHLNDDDIATLLERTEGWAAGLYLAAASLSESIEQTHARDAAASGDNLIASYLRDHLLTNLTGTEQQFLMRSSILKRMSGPLCDAVLGTTGSEETLARLAVGNMLLVRVEGEPHWYRLHQLFAEALRSELARLQPEVVRQVHSRASAWLEANGHMHEAIEHGIAAGETARTARLIWDQVGELLPSGGLRNVERWLDSFTTRQVAAQAKLALTAAWCSLYRGRPAEHWVNAAEHGLYEIGQPRESESVAGATALLHAMLAPHSIAQMADDARLAMRLQEPDDIWRCTAMLLDALGAHLSNHVVEAQAKYREVGELALAFNAPAVLVSALTQLAAIAIEVNDWHDAELLMERAVAEMQEHHLEHVPLLLTTHCMSALLAARQSDTEGALALARRCSRMLALTSHVPAVDSAQCRYLLARTQLMVGDTPAARILLSEALSGLIEMGDATLLRELVEKTWRQVEHMSLGMTQGVSALTTAELRVLQFLPTHLSFEQIGKELFVSRNTVKSQAIAAYRKLGVSSRTEAVERAQALGLLGR
jgi:LuxR family maltose regulon positive regulatory protein